MIRAAVPLAAPIAALLAVVLAAVSACAAAEGAARSGPAVQIGVLAATCTPDRVAAQAEAGIRLAVLDVAWERYEPRPGVFDAGYAAQVRDKVATCQRAGIALVLGPGLQYPPDWVLGLPAGTYRDRDGAAPDPPVANLVFSGPVREAATGYLTRLDADLGLERFAGVRIGTTHTGEFGYPGPVTVGDPPAAYWAFDEAAQGGPDLATGATPSPLPGWVPGRPTWRGAPATPAEARAWFRWYADSVVSTLRWEVALLRRLGFAGDMHVPVAGRGVLPADLADATTDLLGHADPGGALGRGLDYPAQFAALAHLDAHDGPGRLVVDFTGLDDLSAVHARALDPPRDGCRANDEQALRTGARDLASWSAQRFTTAAARLAGLPLVGENPGSPDLADTGGAPDSDALSEQLQQAPRYARECGLTQFFWAFENSLYDHDSGVTVTDLKAWVHPPE